MSGGAGQVFAHWAALALWGHHLLAVGHHLALHVAADAHAVVAHAHTARCGLPNVVVSVDLAIHFAAQVFHGSCSGVQTSRT